MLTIRKPISIDEALHRLLKEEIIPLKEEIIPLSDCVGRWLSRNVYSDIPVPPFSKAAMDGFAIRAEDIHQASSTNPIVLKVQGAIHAGDGIKEPLLPQHTYRIMTGSPLPPGADTIAMFEITKEQKEGNNIILTRPLRKGENVSHKGEDIQMNDCLLQSGSRITPGMIAVLATAGMNLVPVWKQPTVALFATGNELVEPGEYRENHLIRNSNGPMLTAQLTSLGSKVTYCGILRDHFPTILEKLSEAIVKYDIVLTTGGISVGDYDYLLAAHEELGAKLLFNKIAMRPGSVTSASILNGKLLFGLSGNPSACFVGCQLLVGTYIKRLMGDPIPLPKKIKGILGVDFPKPNPFHRYVRSQITFENGHILAKPSGHDKSNIIHSLSHANALMVLPGGTRGFCKGDSVDIILLEGSSI